MTSRLAIYPGSFDPVTNGHLDIMRRASRIFDRVVVSVATNVSKGGLFSPEERAELLRGVLDGQPKFEVALFSGLLIDYARERSATSIVRGLRALADFEYEFQLALMNRQMDMSIDTVFLMTDESHLYISSSLVKEIATFGGDVSRFVPAPVDAALRKKFAGNA